MELGILKKNLLYILPQKEKKVVPCSLGPSISLGGFWRPRTSRPLNSCACLLTEVRKPEIAAQELPMAFWVVHFWPLSNTRGSFELKKNARTHTWAIWIRTSCCYCELSGFVFLCLICFLIPHSKFENRGAAKLHGARYLKKHLKGWNRENL